MKESFIEFLPIAILAQISFVGQDLYYLGYFHEIGKYFGLN
jgi:hypothetical protein